jgi:dihydropyrimidine dehydrogenase (NADP+)
MNVTPRYAKLKVWAQAGTKSEVIGWENIELISDRPFETMLAELQQLEKEYPDRILVASIMEEHHRASWEEIIGQVEATGVVCGTESTASDCHMR